MNEEFELITVTISLAATAKRKQLSNCHRQTSFQCSHAFGKEGRNSSTLCAKTFIKKTSSGLYLLQLVKERNKFFPCFYENVKNYSFGLKFTNWCTLLARGALCTSFILPSVYDCVSSSERASIASNWCVRSTECCRKDIKGHQSSSRGRVWGCGPPNQTWYLFETKILTTIGSYITV